MLCEGLGTLEAVRITLAVYSVQGCANCGLCYDLAFLGPFAAVDDRQVLHVSWVP